MSFLKQVRNEEKLGVRLEQAIKAISEVYQHDLVENAPAQIREKVAALNRIKFSSLEAIGEWERGWLEVINLLKGGLNESQSNNASLGEQSARIKISRQAVG